MVFGSILEGAGESVSSLPTIFFSTTPNPLLSGFPIQRQLQRVWVWERVCLGRNVAGGWGRHVEKLLKGEAVFPCWVTVMHHPASPPLVKMEGIIAHMLSGHLFLERPASVLPVGLVEARIELQGRTSSASSKHCHLPSAGVHPAVTPR